MEYVLPRYDASKGKIEHFLARAVRRLMLNSVRDNAARASGDPVPEPQSEDAAAHEIDLILAELEQQTAKRLSKCKARTLAALIAAKGSIKIMADTLGISRSACDMRIFRLRADLAELQWSNAGHRDQRREHQRYGCR
jgi:DNA-directed RNA polymerase specialized sigma24 family protein